MQLIQCSLLLSALYMFRAVFRPSSGAYKTVCTALGIVIFSYCLPLVWLGWNCSLHVLLCQISAFVLYSFLLMFGISFACLASINLTFQPIHTSGRQQESMTIPKVAHTVL